MDAGAGDTGLPGADASADAGPDASADAGPDASADAGPDAGFDPVPDGGVVAPGLSIYGVTSGGGRAASANYRIQFSAGPPMSATRLESTNYSLTLGVRGR